uniref:Uncharacterized protein n=1 Tax=Davidia involucrata TaxID=16924 RepID=A0A5B7C855_DAVIN
MQRFKLQYIEWNHPSYSWKFDLHGEIVSAWEQADWIHSPRAWKYDKAPLSVVLRQDDICIKTCEAKLTSGTIFLSISIWLLWRFRAKLKARECCQGGKK